MTNINTWFEKINNPAFVGQPLILQMQWGLCIITQIILEMHDLISLSTWKLNETRFHILQRQAPIISSYKVSHRWEFTFIFLSLRRGDDWRVIKQSSTFWDYICNFLNIAINHNFSSLTEEVWLTDWLTNLIKGSLQKKRRNFMTLSQFH